MCLSDHSLFFFQHGHEDRWCQTPKQQHTDTGTRADKKEDSRVADAGAGTSLSTADRARESADTEAAGSSARAPGASKSTQEQEQEGGQVQKVETEKEQEKEQEKGQEQAREDEQGREEGGILPTSPVVNSVVAAVLVGVVAVGVQLLLRGLRR